MQTALEATRTKADGSPASAATVNTSVAAVKALLGFAHQVGFTRFNAAPLIKLKKAPPKLMSEVENAPADPRRHAGAQRHLLEIAYFGGLRVSELAGFNMVTDHSARNRRGAARHRRQG